MFEYLKKRFKGITTEKFDCSILDDNKRYHLRSGYMFKGAVYSVLSKINKNDNLQVDIKIKQNYSWTMSLFTVKVSIVGGTVSERQQLMATISYKLATSVELFIDGDLASLEKESGIQ